MFAAAAAAVAAAVVVVDMYSSYLAWHRFDTFDIGHSAAAAAVVVAVEWCMRRQCHSSSHLSPHDAAAAAVAAVWPSHSTVHCHWRCCCCWCHSLSDRSAMWMRRLRRAFALSPTVS